MIINHYYLDDLKSWIIKPIMDHHGPIQMLQPVSGSWLSWMQDSLAPAAVRRDAEWKHGIPTTRNDWVMAMIVIELVLVVMTPKKISQLDSNPM